jgi:UDP-N-acetylglucosamine diphosphorylase/glucosamine-1-phosphate N-acetyltransferase
VSESGEEAYIYFMNLVFFDDPELRVNLLPFTYTRPIAHVRVGILTLAEKWHMRLKPANTYYQTEEYLKIRFPSPPSGEEVLMINGAVCPDDTLVKAIEKLEPNNVIIKDGMLIAYRSPKGTWPDATPAGEEWPHEVLVIRHPWHMFQYTSRELRTDFALITRGRTSSGMNDAHTICYAPENIFIEPGVQLRAAVLNAEDGPIYLGKNAVVQEGALIKGPFALGEDSVVNMGAKMRGDTSVGPHCKVGGEISNSVFFGYSNKAHDGFLGNSVIGEWCNLGADTNTSNLKNNYEPVKLWSYAKNGFINTGLQFCGLMMGDHSKCGINTMFNTGTVVGVSANIFGDGFPRNFIPSFAWGGAAGFTTFQLSKAYDTAEKVMGRRKLPLQENDKIILKQVFEASAVHRIWEKK